MPTVGWKQAVGLLLALGLWGSAEMYAQASSEVSTDGRPLLDQAIAALGGPAYLNVTNVTTVGRLYEFRNGVTAGAVMFKDIVEYPDKVRSEYGRKHELVMINNRLQGWAVENGIVRTQSADDVVQFLRSQQHDLDRLLRWRLQQEKIEIISAGKETVENAPAFKLDLVFPGVETVNLFLDARTKLPIKFSFQGTPVASARAATLATKKNAKEPMVQEEIVFSNYHPVDGVNVPFHQLISRNGDKAAEIFVEQVQFNSSLSESLFASPSAPSRVRR